MNARQREERADVLLPWFDAQLRFAGRQAECSGLTLATAVATFTTLHRRFGLGRIHGDPTDPAWFAYTVGLERCPDHAARLAWTRRTYVESPPESEELTDRHFGCFNYDPPDAEGVVRIHFVNRDSGVSPLSRARQPQREAELRSMFAQVRSRHPTARLVRGTSWLYHLEAYRRLFPTEYGASRRLPPRGARYQGNSNWGQFLTHEGGVHADRIDRLLGGLPRLDPAEPWRVFPLPALLTEAPVESFTRWYASGERAVPAQHLP
ncbi:MAG: hypothetical protein KF911_05735 [Pseudomonadales bacterium]|nr:hypothetical protein [Pseudomonadales bacterium]